MDRKTSKNIICFGSLIMDISIRCDKIPAMGETVYTYEDYNVNPGGKGGNQSVAAARSGGSVTLIGRIADDDYAHQLIHSFQKDHIDTSQPWCQCQSNRPGCTVLCPSVYRPQYSYDYPGTQQPITG